MVSGGGGRPGVWCRLAISRADGQSRREKATLSNDAKGYNMKRTECILD